MMTEDYVSFETAKLLKEKGFDESTRMFYEVSNYPSSTAKENFKKITGIDMEQIEIHSLYGLEDESFFNSVQGKDENQVACPTLQMAMKWLREIHKLCISITPQVTDDDGDGGCLWQFAITSHLEPLSISLELYEQYEQACEAAIKYCLENLI